MAQLGPDALVRTAYIAQQHFIEGKTRIEIAAETGLYAQLPSRVPGQSFRNWTYI